MSSSDRPQPSKGDGHIIPRGVKKSNPLGTGLFVGLRALDPLLQYGILTHSIGSTLLAKVGLQQLPLGLRTNTGTVIDSLGLSPYRLILLGMATGSALKQIYWLLVTSEEEFPPSASIAVSVFNSFGNTLNSLAFTSALTSASLASNETFPQTPLIVGTVLYTVGILTEAISETQRRSFKRDPKNKGKPFTGGLFSAARHINYTGYTFWRVGYAIAAGGWTLGAIIASLSIWKFTTDSVPALDKYCTERVTNLSVPSHYIVLTIDIVRRGLGELQEENSLQTDSIRLLNVRFRCQDENFV
jgi:protein-S-isoprenylcysteine O-methyltransferase Ste14